ncbi:GNAT family N-acetyltransferase [Sphaerisporangium rufum]|uniref:GNAT family N-acetyltransferase n=1 Tax=Sphaerisporangium rufum TaxID=1381558 RepID=UPI0019514AD8|nr:GNAT family N-acetyltransferase [Sphaerisporangium rufum]
MSDADLTKMEIPTARLVLRRPAAEDIDAIFTVNGDPRACAHNPSDLLGGREDAVRLFHRWDRHWQEHGLGYWTVRRHDSATPLGFCGTKYMDLDGMRVLNLFYRFDPAAWGRGYASEAAGAVVGWVRDRLPGFPIVARVRPGNAASQRVAVRAGLVRCEHLDTAGEDGLDWIYAANLPEQTGTVR